MARSRLLDALLSLALLGLFATLIWLAAVQPLQGWRQAQLDARADAIAETQKLKSSIATLRAERDRYDIDGQLDVLWEAERTGTATAMIQSEISRMARDQGVSLRAITPARQRDLSLADAVGIRIELEAALDQLSDFLKVVEYHSPALLIERATLRRLAKPGSALAQPLVFAQIDLAAPFVIQAEDQQ
ncbi:type II secretion system protein GspM [Thalassococcus sp. BH17M4-6]|uniref:type II secretion system protein GspM n=1 Tax=Thalassococcus sp. BH17M4-6 TaxID=3413148 RepID=UPI003BE67690